MAYYANSRFKKSVNEWGRVEEWIEPGDKISQSDIGVSDDEWKSLVDRGIVVESYPDDLDPQTPPAEYYRANLDEAPELNVDETTPSDEAMGQTETADEQGHKLPGANEADSTGEKKPGWLGNK